MYFFLKTGFYPILIVDKMIFIDCIKMFCTFFITTGVSLYICTDLLDSLYSCILRWWWSWWRSTHVGDEDEVRQKKNETVPVTLSI